MSRPTQPRFRVGERVIVLVSGVPPIPGRVVTVTPASDGYTYLVDTPSGPEPRMQVAENELRKFRP